MRKVLGNQEGRAWFVCTLLPRFWYLQAPILSLLIKTWDSIIFLLTGPHKKKHQPSVTPTVFWITRVLLIKEDVFCKRHPFPTDFPKNIASSSKITAFLSCMLTAHRPFLQIHVQLLYLHSSYLQHYSLLSQGRGTQTLDFKCLDIFGNLDQAHQSIVRKPQQSHAIQEFSYFLHFSTKTIYNYVFRPHPATLTSKSSGIFIPGLILILPNKMIGLAWLQQLPSWWL